MKKQINKCPLRLVLLLILMLSTAIILMACHERVDRSVSEGDSCDGRLYWNVEKYVYADSQEPRVLRDGQYYVRFAVDGKQVDLQVKDKLLVDYIDTMEVMGLVFDANGVVVDALRVDEFYGRILAEDDYVTSFTDSQIVCNTMGNGKGLVKTIALHENTQVYYWLEDGSVLCGLPGSIKEGSKILAVADAAGVVTHVYTKDPFQVGNVYWNTARKYDSVTKLSTRPLDELGRFVFEFVIDGKNLTLYTRDQEMANKVDGVAARCMGLSYDESGYIQEVYTTQKMTGGKSWGSWYYIMNISGDILEGKKFSGSNVGQETRGTMAKDCKVYDVSGTGEFMGQPTTLRRYDQVHGLRNEHGEICILFVVSRSNEADIYYNLERKYDSTNKTTKRVPGADGYYRIQFAHDGRQITLKTRDKDIVDLIDAEAARCLGLKLDGDEILEAYRANYVWGGKQFCSYDIVTAIDADGTITAQEADASKGNKTYVGRMAEDCRIYNVSATAVTKGEKTTLRVGDKIHALKDLEGNVTYIYVVGRTYRVPIYYNVDRQYDSANKITRRTPNEEGYYEIVLAINGEQKTFKTKDKALMTKIDAVATRCFGLSVKGDVITAMYATANVHGGTQFCSYDYVTAIKGNTVVAQEADASKGEQTYTGYMTKSTKVYNVSGTAQLLGEPTTLQVGDKIHALKYADGGLNIIYVVERIEKVEEQTAFCELCREDVTWYSWDGVAEFEAGKHYFLKRNINLSDTAYIGSTEDSTMEVTLDLRGYDIRAAVRAFRIYGTFNLLDTVGDGVIYGNASGQATGFYVYDAATFNLYGGTFQGGENANTQCGIGALGLNKGSNAVFNMYGGSLIGGNTAKDGGNLTLYHSSVFNMYGGSIADGQTLEEGGNIYADSQAKLNLYGGSITGGQASTGNCVYGGQISLYNTAAVVVDEIVLSSPMHVPEILAADSQIHVVLASGSGAVTGATPEANLDYIQAVDAQLVYQGGKLIIPGKPDKTAYCQHCRQEADWYIWDGQFALEDGGHYFLAGDVSVSATAYIGAADNSAVKVCLDLNGKNIDASVRVFRIYGNLNLMDSEDSGVITGNTAGQASVFYVYENAVFNMYGGTMTSQKTVTSDSGAGIGGIDKGTMNLYGGKITGGVAKRSGGNLNLYNTGVLNLYGGSIENGTSLENSGGNIHMSTKSQLHIYGGSILGGNAGNLGDCINANGAVTVYGQDRITVTEIYLPGSKTLSIEGTLAAESSIGILLANDTGVFTGETAEANREFFHSDTYEVEYVGGKLQLQAPEIPPEDPDAHWHCICGGLGAKGDHTGCANVEWTPWPGADALVLDGSVYYYLTEDVTVDTAIKLTEGQTLNLCLNGCTLSTTKKIYIFDISGTLNICDHAENKGAVTNLYAGTSHSMAFYLRGSASGSTMNLFGGTFSAPNGKATGTGGTVARVGTSAGTCTFKMYGGCITGGRASGAAIAGNLVLEQGSTSWLYGGLITGGNNDKGAGNVMLKNGAKLNLDGGSITAGTGLLAGNVYIKEKCSLSAIAGSIIGGTVYVEGTITLGDGAVVEQIEYAQ